MFTTRNQRAQQPSVSGVVTAMPGKSVAVLPFESLSDDTAPSPFTNHLLPGVVGVPIRHYYFQY
ncbi:MAG TPA: hypothetical protein VN957_15750 [Chthoniobacterales bacterium]|nr:hypothetical protein [Chthoniobacterales bacterium]